VAAVRRSVGVEVEAAVAVAAEAVVAVEEVDESIFRPCSWTSPIYM
jgi:hypothetical protein